MRANPDFPTQERDRLLNQLQLIQDGMAPSTGRQSLAILAALSIHHIADEVLTMCDNQQQLPPGIQAMLEKLRLIADVNTPVSAFFSQYWLKQAYVILRALSPEQVVVEEKEPVESRLRRAADGEPLSPEEQQVLCTDVLELIAILTKENETLQNTCIRHDERMSI